MNNQKVVLLSALALTVSLAGPLSATTEASSGLWIAIQGNGITGTLWEYAGSGATTMSYSPTGLTYFSDVTITASLADSATPELRLSVSGNDSNTTASAKDLKVYVVDMNSGLAYADPQAKEYGAVSGILSASGTASDGATVTSLIGLHNNVVNLDSGGIPSSGLDHGGGDIDIGGDIDVSPTTGPGCTPSAAIICPAAGTAFNPAINLNTGGAESANGSFVLAALPESVFDEIEITLAGDPPPSPNSGSFDVTAGANVPEPFSLLLLATVCAILASAFARKFRNYN